METLLKLNAPVRMNCSKATYDLSLGTIERGQRTSEHYEMQGHQWADLTADAGTHGVSIINDCKYGWDMPGSNSLRLTLIHTPRCDSYTHHATQDIGDHHFTVAYFPHEGKWSESTQIEASKVNQPLMAFVAPKHDGAQGREFGFARLSTDKVAIKALKKAERSDEYIVRVYEWTGERQENVGITFPSEIVSAREVNGLEENFDDAAPVTTRGARMIFSIDRYSPKTFAVKLKDPDAAVKLAAVNETYIDLAYDTDMMSLNSKRKDVTSGVEAAYPGELVADVINHENVSFRMGGRGEGEMNALGCKGQTLQFTRKPGQDKLYILAASTNKNGSKGEFGVGNGQVEISVAYNGGRHQQFVITDAPDGYYHITDRNSGRVIEIPESKTGNGEWAKLWENNGTDTQHWYLRTPTGVEEIAAPATEGGMAEVYDLTGRMVKTVDASRPDYSGIPAGIYIIRTAGRAVKVAVK